MLNSSSAWEINYKFDIHSELVANAGLTFTKITIVPGSSEKFHELILTLQIY